MRRLAIRGFVMLGALGLVATAARAQLNPDVVEVRNRKDGTTKTVRGQLKVTKDGFAVYTGEKLDKAGEPIAPEDIVKVSIGDLPGVDRSTINALAAKEDKKTAKDYAEARDGYKGLVKAGLAERSKRYLEYKVATLNHRLVDELEPDAGWKEKADAAISDWKGFLGDYKSAPGWETWSGARALTRLLAERGRHDEAAAVWAALRQSPDMPPDAKFEAALQELDAQVRGKAYPNAVVGAGNPELQKQAGARKERLGIYELAAKAGSEGKHLEGVDKIKAAMDKTKDAGVHATGFAMMGELYLAAGKPRDAMWMFLWVETVANQERDDVFKAVVRLTEIFEAQMDEDQSKKYRDKLKRLRATF